MSDEPQENTIQIPLNFPYIEGNLPAYANTLIVNPSPEGLIIDFGFFDPILARQLQEKWKEENITDITQVKPIDVQPVGRIFISRPVAEQLLERLQETLPNVSQ